MTVVAQKIFLNKEKAIKELDELVGKLKETFMEASRKLPEYNGPILLRFEIRTAETPFNKVIKK